MVQTVFAFYANSKTIQINGRPLILLMESFSFSGKVDNLTSES